MTCKVRPWMVEHPCNPIVIASWGSNPFIKSSSFDSVAHRCPQVSTYFLVRCCTGCFVSSDFVPCNIALSLNTVSCPCWSQLRVAAGSTQYPQSYQDPKPAEKAHMQWPIAVCKSPKYWGFVPSGACVSRVPSCDSAQRCCVPCIPCFAATQRLS